MLIDALQCGEFDRGAFEALARGGYTCVTPTLGFWEGTLESMDSLGRWRDLERDNADLIRIVRKAEDIRTCEKDGKVGILLGYQNTNLLEDRIRFVELFAFGGLPRDAQVEVDAYRIHYEEVRLVGSFHHTPRHFRAALAFLASGAYPFERLVTHEVGLDGVAGLFDDPPRDFLKAAVRP